jgi:hypothetical protein
MPPAEKITPTELRQPAADSSHKFHLEIDLSQRQLQEIGAGAVAAAGAVTLGVIEFRTGRVGALASHLLPLTEDFGTELWASAMKTVRATPKLDSFALKNGLECSYDRNVSLFSKPTDLVSIVDQIGNEAHLYANGSRTVVRASIDDVLRPLSFYDEAAVGVHVPVPKTDLASVLFNNKALTPKNLRLYKKVENSFWTGYTKPLERLPNLLDEASEF